MSWRAPWPKSYIREDTSQIRSTLKGSKKKQAHSMVLEIILTYNLIQGKRLWIKMVLFCQQKLILSSLIHNKWSSKLLQGPIDFREAFYKAWWGRILARHKKSMLLPLSSNLLLAVPSTHIPLLLTLQPRNLLTTRTTLHQIRQVAT